MRLQNKLTKDFYIKEINANDKTNNQFHMPSFVFHFHLQNLQPDNVFARARVCVCTDRNGFNVIFCFHSSSVVVCVEHSFCAEQSSTEQYIGKNKLRNGFIQPDANPNSPATFSYTRFNTTWLVEIVNLICQSFRTTNIENEHYLVGNFLFQFG